MHSPSILILDSGAGGLSVAGEIRNRLPGARYVYLADTEFFPYGMRSESELLYRVCQAIEFATARFAIDIAVIACNTASTAILDSLRTRFSIPFVGVVPAIKPAARLSQTGAIGLLATNGTVSRSYTTALIKEFAGHCSVYLYGSPTLVEIAEAKLRGEHPDPFAISHELDGLLSQAPKGKIDTVVLACTHFPLLGDELTQCAPDITYWVDSGEAIARRVNHWVNHLGLIVPSSLPSALEQNRILVTSDSAGRYHSDTLTKYLGPHRIEVVQI